MLHLNVVSQGNLPHTHWDIAMVTSKLSSNLITHRHQSAYPWTYSPQNINTCSVTRQLVHPAGWLLGEEKMWHFKLSLGAQSDSIWRSHSALVAFPLQQYVFPLWQYDVPTLTMWHSHSNSMGSHSDSMTFPLWPCGIPTLTAWRSQTFINHLKLLVFVVNQHFYPHLRYRQLNMCTEIRQKHVDQLYKWRSFLVWGLIRKESVPVCWGCCMQSLEPNVADKGRILPRHHKQRVLQNTGKH